MTLAPRSFAWLLRHELRLALRGTGTRTSWWARNLPLLLLAILPAVFGILGAFALRHAGSVPTREALGFVRAAVFGLLLLMISTASIAVLRTFYDRHDLDLLLSAPVPPARILAAKSVGVAGSVAVPFMLFIAPFVLASAVLGHPGWLGGLVMVAVDATVATSFALVLTSLVFRAIGPRRARVGVQLVAALLGGTIFLVAQLRNVAPAVSDRLFRAATGDWPVPLDWPARAAFGEALPLAAMVVVAAAVAAGAARFGARHLIASADGGGPARVARTGPIRFRSGFNRILIAKELRLIARDPELITQLALRLVYVIPFAAVMLRGGAHHAPGPGIATAATAFAGLLASSLAWIIVCAEDAPDLIAAAPVPPAAVFRAKLTAACLPSLAIAAIASVIALGSAPWAGAVIVTMGLVAALTAALLQAWFGKVRPRAAFRQRQSGSFVVGVGEVVMAGAWSGTAGLLAAGSIWAIAPALLGGLIMAGAIEARPRPAA